MRAHDVEIDGIIRSTMRCDIQLEPLSESLKEEFFGFNICTKFRKHRTSSFEHGINLRESYSEMLTAQQTDEGAWSNVLCQSFDENEIVRQDMRLMCEEARFRWCRSWHLQTMAPIWPYQYLLSSKHEGLFVGHQSNQWNCEDWRKARSLKKRSRLMSELKKATQVIDSCTTWLWHLSAGPKLLYPEIAILHVGNSHGSFEKNSMFLLVNNGPCGSLVVSNNDMACLISCSPTKWHEMAWFGAEHERIHGSFTHYKCISDHAVLRTSFDWQSRKFLMNVDVRVFKWIVAWKTVRGIRLAWYLWSQRCAVQQSSWKGERTLNSQRREPGDNLLMPVQI